MLKRIKSFGLRCPTLSKQMESPPLAVITPFRLIFRVIRLTMSCLMALRPEWMLRGSTILEVTNLFKWYFLSDIVLVGHPNLAWSIPLTLGVIAMMGGFLILILLNRRKKEQKRKEFEVRFLWYCLSFLFYNCFCMSNMDNH
jgi:hypothetical protein